MIEASSYVPGAFLPLSSVFLAGLTLFSLPVLSAAPCRAEASPAPAEQAAPSRQEGLLLVAFGTSHQDATVSYKELEKDMLAHYAPDRLKWSYTSSIIRRKLAGRGTPVPSVEENLEQMARKGIRTLRVQSLHIAPGEEFSRMERQIVSFLARHPDSFDHVFIGRPLLESERDRNEAITALLEHFPAERKKDEAILLMGHGQQEGRCDMVLSDFARELNDRDSLAFFATVEGTRGVAPILEQLKKSGAKTVWLAPSCWWPETTPRTTWAGMRRIPGLPCSGRRASPSRPTCVGWGKTRASAPFSPAMPGPRRTTS
ncbi:sirohydrochlorin cobaltochelatase [Akkermansia sp. EB-AMDK43]|uniref:sirohydrochlorin cobaltochelatase n=1 Tax=Akkermansia sp. EB-AMDK43 TaxID=3073964 RepID=UPI002868F21B|nr:sirohydrochlorin cobaltochelatase [Akkermansia sp. EB-AMDK43]WMX38114.1 sirohydrochlorin cobaltochelatase [Akkermansia sp. EB-AMDK43]